MTKNFKNYLIYWAILLVLFNVLAFVGSMWRPAPMGAAFWIGYVCIMIAFLGQLFMAYKALSETNRTKLFYKLSLVSTSFTGLILSFIFGGLCMVIGITAFYWIAVIVCALVLAFSAIAVLKASVAADAVAAVDQKIKVQTFFIKSLTVDAQTLMDRAPTPELKDHCRKIYEAIRYSDPMSSDALATAESQITVQFTHFSDAVTGGNGQIAGALAQELLILIADRNRKCKLLK